MGFHPCEFMRSVDLSLWADPPRDDPTRPQRSLFSAKALFSSSPPFDERRWEMIFPQETAGTWRLVNTQKREPISGLWLGHPSEKYERQLGWLFPIYGKIKNVPNHQPDILCLAIKRSPKICLSKSIQPKVRDICNLQRTSWNKYENNIGGLIPTRRTSWYYQQTLLNILEYKSQQRHP